MNTKLKLKLKKKKAFVVFITAGYPNFEVTRKLVLEFDRIGVDIVELGVPFSDPLADGRVIQAASQEALSHGVNLKKIFSLIKTLRTKTQIPICLMTYYNPVFCFGEKHFVQSCRTYGVDGVIIPDLPPEEGKQLRYFANKAGLATILFLSPTSSLERIKLVSSLARGFIYYVSLTGVTGPRKKLPLDLKQHLSLIKRNTNKPVCVGFGISSRKQIKQIRHISDGVIVGSAIVNKIKENIARRDIVERVSNFVAYLKR
jgi:tryptophan synthase alpha chain